MHTFTHAQHKLPQDIPPHIYLHTIRNDYCTLCRRNNAARDAAPHIHPSHHHCRPHALMRRTFSDACKCVQMRSHANAVRCDAVKGAHSPNSRARAWRIAAIGGRSSVALNTLETAAAPAPTKRRAILCTGAHTTFSDASACVPSACGR